MVLKISLGTYLSKYLSTLRSLILGLSPRKEELKQGLKTPFHLGKNLSLTCTKPFIFAVEQKWKFLSTLSLKKYLCTSKQKWIYNSSVFSKCYITLQTGIHSAKQCDFYFFFPFSELISKCFSLTPQIHTHPPSAFHPTLQLWVVECSFITVSDISFYTALFTSPGFATPPNLVASINLITVLLTLIYRSLVKIKLDLVLVLKAHH